MDVHQELNQCGGQLHGVAVALRVNHPGKHPRNLPKLVQVGVGGWDQEEITGEGERGRCVVTRFFCRITGSERLAISARSSCVGVVSGITSGEISCAWTKEVSEIGSEYECVSRSGEISI